MEKTPHDEALRRGEAAMENEKNRRMFAYNPGKQQRTFPAHNPYTISRCSTCSKAKMNLAAKINTNELCAACGIVRKCTDVTAQLKSLHTKHGKEYIDVLKEITRIKIFQQVDGLKHVFSAVGENDKDYLNLMNGAKKISSHGYSVYILPNPTGIKSGDFILVKGGFVGLYDLKTIFGNNSASNRLADSKGQANRVILNIASHYNPRRLAGDIKNYFDLNLGAEEVIVVKGGKMLTTTRTNIRARKWAKQFCEDYTKKK